MSSATVSVKLKTINRLIVSLKADLTINGTYGYVLKQWAVRYRGWAQTRFAKYSHGQGNWPALAPATLKRRRNKSIVAILRDTNTLYSTLNPVFSNLPGQYEQGIPGGIAVGIGGGSSHPDAPVTVGELAAIHHLGLGHVPARPILEPPPTHIRNFMRQDLLKAIQKERNA